MRITRIYQPAELNPGRQLELDQRSARHLVQVLRLQPPHPLVVFDGQGHVCHAVLSKADKKSVVVELGAAIAESPESPLAVHLGLGISKGERMDIAIQKAVELGVTAITPLFTRYSMVKLDPARAEKRLEHWQGIIISVCEQCGRNRLPLLHTIINSDDWLRTNQEQLKLTLDPQAEISLGSIPTPTGTLSLYIGPEGGLSDEEIAQAKQYGFQGVRLGPRILRTETAVIAALTAVQFRWGDLG